MRGEVFDVGFNTSHQDFYSPPPDHLAACPLPQRGGPIEHGGGGVGSNSHGAATSGIIFGNGFGNSSARGLLPCGQTIIAYVPDVGYTNPSRYWHTCELVQCACCPTDPPDPTCTADPQCPYQAVFQSASVGKEDSLVYNTSSAGLDDIIFDFDVVHCQAQGNRGVASDPEGSRYSAPEAWAKNTISVGGAHHFNRTNLTDHNWWGPEPGPWGPPDYQPDYYWASSIGPAADGRIKPDLCHAFDNILTTNGVFPNPVNGYQHYFHGTSAATPIVCGHVGLLMEMWADDSDADGKNIFGVAVPSCNPATENCVFKRRPHAATAKALLINTARQYEWAIPPYATSLDRNKQGWGMPDIAAVYDLRQKMAIVNETHLLTELGFKWFTVKAPASQPKLNATLVYSDPPGTSSTVHLINNLTMQVVSPSCLFYWGNYGLTNDHGQTAGLWSVEDANPKTTERDNLNNVENVFVQNPAAGLWRIHVRADDITEDGHVETTGEPYDADFALVVSGALPAGACNLTGGGCVMTDRADCLAQGGTYAGDYVGSCFTWPDCNTNYIDDACDIAGGLSEDCEPNGIPDECGPRISCCIPDESCKLTPSVCCGPMGGYQVSNCNLCPL